MRIHETAEQQVGTRAACAGRRCVQGAAAQGLTRSPLLAVVACMAVLALVACAGGKEPSFYTLQSPAEATMTPAVRAASVLVIPGPVRVPDALDRSAYWASAALQGCSCHVSGRDWAEMQKMMAEVLGAGKLVGLFPSIPSG